MKIKAVRDRPARAGGPEDFWPDDSEPGSAAARELLVQVQRTRDLVEKLDQLNTRMYGSFGIISREEVSPSMAFLDSDPEPRPGGSPGSEFGPGLPDQASTDGDQGGHQPDEVTARAS